MQPFDINLIQNLQRALRCDFLDWFFYCISIIGSEYFFLALAAVLFWCVNKRFGYRFTNIFFVGQIFVGSLKSIVRRPRPYDNGAAAVIDKTSGWSFPSGHAQNAANMATQLSLWSKNKKTAIITAVITVLVMLSRMYLGQHYLTDVIAGAVLGVAIAILFTHLFALMGNREEWLFVVILPLTVILAAVMLFTSDNPSDTVKVCGVYGAVTLGYFLEKRYVGYKEKSGGIIKQILKLALGLAILLALKEGISLICSAAKLTGTGLAAMDYLRYFAVGIFATLGAPALFKRIKI